MGPSSTEIRTDNFVQSFALGIAAWPRELDALVARYATRTDEGPDECLRPVGQHGAQLPGAESLVAGDVDALLITGVPDCIADPDSVLRALAHAMALAPIRYDSEGAVIIDIRDQGVIGRPGFANSQQFDLHTDLSYVENPPELMAMHVVTASCSGGHTLLATADRAVSQLDPHDIALLTQPAFCFNPPKHYTGDAEASPRPILRRRSTTSFWVRFRHDGLTAITPAAERAAQRFADALKACQIEIPLPERSVLILDNFRVLHGRTAFENSGSASQRLLKRMYMTVEPSDGAYCD